MRTFSPCVCLVAVVKRSSAGHRGLLDFWVLEAQPATSISALVAGRIEMLEFAKVISSNSSLCGKLWEQREQTKCVTTAV